MWSVVAWDWKIRADEKSFKLEDVYEKANDERFYYRLLASRSENFVVVVVVVVDVDGSSPLASSVVSCRGSTANLCCLCSTSCWNVEKEWSDRGHYAERLHGAGE